jgi:hypothetical protein
MGFRHLRSRLSGRQAQLGARPSENGDAPMLLDIAFCALLSAAAPAPGLGASDLLLLLEIGVGERDIAAFAATVGGFEPLDAETWAAAESLGATHAFLEKLPRRVGDYGTVSDLARTSDVFEDEALGLAFVYPTGWVVSRTPANGGGVIVRVGPRAAADPRVFISPCLFLFLQPETGVVPDAETPVLGQVRQLLLKKLRAAGLRPAAGSSRTVSFLGRSHDTLAIEASIDGERGGVVEIALDVDGRGRAFGIGFTAAAADRGRLEEAFGALCGSIVLRAAPKAPAPRR